jgi:hypothetical protein
MFEMAVNPFGTAVDESPDPVAERGLQEIAGPFHINFPVHLVGQTDSPEGGGYMKNCLFPGDQTIHKPFIGNTALNQAGTQSFQFAPK